MEAVKNNCRGHLVHLLYLQMKKWGLEFVTYMNIPLAELELVNIEVLNLMLFLILFCHVLSNQNQFK